MGGEAAGHGRHALSAKLGAAAVVWHAPDPRLLRDCREPVAAQWNIGLPDATAAVVLDLHQARIMLARTTGETV